jgi:hypothetical protein
MRRSLAVVTAVGAALVLSAGPAAACGGLIGPNGAVNLSRTTTFAGYANGVEHYITSFEFQGGEGRFGSITPLPGVPEVVEEGGDWTLQRLIRETTPVTDVALSLESASPSAAATPSEAKVLKRAAVGALDVTILQGDGSQVGLWAKKNGFKLPPDAPEVLDFYSQRSPIFMAAAFDPKRAKAKGQRVGDGTPIHLAIPTDRPWVPLRILGLGKQAAERVEADVFLLTQRRPVTLPAAEPDGGGGDGLVLEHDSPATSELLRDLREDKNGGWVPLRDMWLTKIRVDTTAGELKYDLAIDASGAAKPSAADAGLTLSDLPTPTVPTPGDDTQRALAIVAVGLVTIGALALVVRSRPTA